MTEQKKDGGRVKLVLARGEGFKLDVDFELKSTGITILFGPSGCGKTTVLRSVAGLERAANGLVRVGADVWQDTEKKIFVPTWQRPLGYVFQEASLFPHMTARDNLLFGLKHGREARGGGTGRMDEAVELLGLSKLLNHKPAALSGGEQQRVAIARALVLNPEILLMDEPLSALDWARRQEIMPWIEKIRDELQIPVLYVTHSAEEVARLASTIVLMEDGKIRKAGPASQLLCEITAPVEIESDRISFLHGRVKGIDGKYGLACVELGTGDELWISAEGLTQGAEIRVKVFARDVVLANTSDRESSIQNAIACTVKSIEAEKDPSQVLVDMTCGADRLMARLTRRAADSLGLAPGKSVWAQVKTAALSR